MSTAKYKAFISYKHSELGRRHAVALETGLKRYAKPLFQRPISIFRDEKHMVPSNELSKLITDGLDQSEYLIFLAEKEAAQSIWCRQELEYWCDTLGRKDQLIIIHLADPLVLDVENNKVNWQKTEALPDLLQDYIPSIPLYVDLSWATTKEMLSLDNIRYKPIINLIKAKLRGVAPEELNDLELKVFRRNRRLRTGAIIVLSILLVISIIASLFARSQTLEARKQREYALVQEGIARDSAVSAQNQCNIAEIQRNIAQLERDTAQIERDRARAAQLEAEHQRDMALSRQLATQANNEIAVDPSISLALAVEAMQLKRTDQARQMLQAALMQSHVYKIIREHTAQVSQVAYLPQRNQVLSSSFDGQTILWDIKGTIPERVNQGGKRAVQQVQFIRSGQYAVVAGDDVNIELWNLANNSIEKEFPGDIFTLSQNEQLLATASSETDIQIWSLTDGSLKHTFAGHDDYVTGLIFSPDERFLLSASEDKSVRIHPLTEQMPAKEILPHKDGLSGIAFSPNGRYLATSDYEDLTCLWTWPDLEIHRKLQQEEMIGVTRFSHSGELLATAT